MPLIAKEFDLDAAAQGYSKLVLLDVRFMANSGGMLGGQVQARIIIAARQSAGDCSRRLRPFDKFVHALLTRLGLGRHRSAVYPAGGKLNAMWMGAQRARAERHCSMAARRWVRAWSSHHSRPDCGL